MHSHIESLIKGGAKSVLILVVMEDALAHENNWSGKKLTYVLILVVMEDALAPISVLLLQNCGTVLILVVMEDALAQMVSERNTSFL